MESEPPKPPEADGPEDADPGPQSPAPPGYGWVLPNPPPPPGTPPPAPQHWPAPEAPPGPPQPPYGPPTTGGWQQPQAPVFAGAQLAGWGVRAGASLIDFFLLLTIWTVLIVPGTVVIAATDADVIGGVLGGLGILAAIAVGTLYGAFFMQRKGPRNGQTLGKQWLGIRVVRVNGEQFGWGWGLLREVVLKGIALGVASSIASGLTFFLLGIGGLAPYLADYLWPLWDDENRAIHDMVAETRVIRA